MGNHLTKLGEDEDKKKKGTQATVSEGIHPRRDTANGEAVTEPDLRDVKDAAVKKVLQNKVRCSWLYIRSCNESNWRCHSRD